MKNTIKTLSLPLVFAFVVTLSGCGGSDAKKSGMTPQQKAVTALKTGSPWKVKSVDGIPDGSSEAVVSSLELSFEASGTGTTISPTAFSSTGDVDAFTSDPGATWAWTDTGTTGITLTGGFTDELTNIEFLPNVDNPTTVKITFMIATPASRSNAVGEYTLTLQ